VLQSVLRQGLLGNPLRLLSVARAVAPYLTTDSGFGLSAMYGLARSMQGTELGKVQLIEVPIIGYPANPMVQVIWQQPEAGRLLRAVAHDRSVPRTPHSARTARPAPAVPPGKVRVAVLNGDGVAGTAGRTSTYLAGRGFTVVRTGDARTFGHPRTLIEYASPADRPAAATLDRAVAGARLEQSPRLAPGTVRLIIGAGFHGAVAAAAASARTPSVQGLARSYGGVAGSAGICRDQSAFPG